MSINMTMDRALLGASHPVRAKPSKDLLSGSVGATAALACTTLAAGLANSTIRRLRVVNTHATQTLAILLDVSDALVVAQAITDGYRVLPGAAFEIPVQGSMSIGIIGSGAATTFDFKISDFN